jgi:peptide chain release factor 1
VPRHPFADLPCLIEIRPGAGGGEAAIFAGDMLRMYTSYCNRLGLRTSLLKYEDADGAGAGSDAPLQEAVLEVESPGAYGILRCEAGVHRVQRVPATESKGRTHTSAASVLVLPSFPAEPSQDLGENSFDDPNSDYYVDPKDVRTDVMRAKGAGGQHVNTTDSAVRLTHLPTGTVVAIQDARSQHKNREKAWRLLRSRIAQARREQREEEMVALRRSVVGVAKMGRENKIRTYNWGQQRVTDHRSGISVHDLDDVLEGGLELERVMESVRGWLSEQEVLGLAAEEELAAKKDS